MAEDATPEPGVRQPGIAHPAIRAAGQGDAMALFRLLLAMHEENGQASLSHAKVAQQIQQCVSDPGCMVLVAESEPGRLVGSACIEAQAWWYSDEEALFDRWIYVAPEARRSAARIAYGLLNVLKRVSDSNAMPLVLGIASGRDAARKSIFYQRHGFEAVGSFFIYRPAAAIPVAAQARGG